MLAEKTELEANIENGKNEINILFDTFFSFKKRHTTSSSSLAGELINQIQ